MYRRVLCGPDLRQICRGAFLLAIRAGQQPKAHRSAESIFQVRRWQHGPARPRRQSELPDAVLLRLELKARGCSALRHPVHALLAAPGSHLSDLVGGETAGRLVEAAGGTLQLLLPLLLSDGSVGDVALPPLLEVAVVEIDGMNAMMLSQMSSFAEPFHPQPHSIAEAGCRAGISQ